MRLGELIAEQLAEPGLGLTLGWLLPGGYGAIGSAFAFRVFVKANDLTNQLMLEKGPKGTSPFGWAFATFALWPIVLPNFRLIAEEIESGKDRDEDRQGPGEEWDVTMNNFFRRLFGKK